MKKIAGCMIMISMIMVWNGCGNGKDSAGSTPADEASRYETSLSLLEAVVGAYEEEELFAMYGGDTEHAVMDAPGQFDLSKTEEMDQSLGLPESQSGAIDDAASMVHLMNGNTFTGAAWHVKQETDIEAFTDAVQSNILEKQWLCGQPETLLIVQADAEYIITAYGAADIVEVFKQNVLSVADGAKVLTETPIVQ
ncbi:MAG: hypothetical protein HFJ04_02865 [Lachnospiraceae bacterium]|nr:hypothetical protein [Lachnospiraceae bacterium]